MKATHYHSRNGNALKLYDGPSLIDGERIIVILTGLKTVSANTKTGDMLQTFIMRYDVKPNDAIKTGEDSSVCGNCPLRPFLFDGSVSEKPCYVKVFQAPRSTWEANRDLPVAPPEVVREAIGDRDVRAGSYGDPAAVPAYVWTTLPRARKSNGKTRKRTGYTHQWKLPMAADFARLTMASVHSLEERAQAKAKGFRTFRIIGDVRDVAKGEILCPASKEAGERTTCAKCGLCDGSTGGNDKRKDVAIVAH